LFFDRIEFSRMPYGRLTPFKCFLLYKPFSRDSLRQTFVEDQKLPPQSSQLFGAINRLAFVCLRRVREEELCDAPLQSIC